LKSGSDLFTHRCRGDGCRGRFSPRRSTMLRRLHIAAALLVAAGGLLGWLIASGRLTPDAKAQYNPVIRASAEVPGGGPNDPNVLPRPEPPFKGKIGRTAKESTPDFPKPAEAPKGAPNVLLILTDDVGFGASSTFGGPIETPNYDKLAKS